MHFLPVQQLRSALKHLRTAAQEISAPGKDFVRRLLEKDPRKRLRVTEALAHPWVCVLHAAPQTRLSGVVVERLVAFTRSSRLERALLNLVAKHLSRSDIGHLEAMFKALDTDGDGRAPPPRVSVAWGGGLVRWLAALDDQPRQGVLFTVNICCALGVSLCLLHVCPRGRAHQASGNLGWSAGHPVARCAERVTLPRARRLSAEDLRGGLGAVGRKMSSAAVERLVSDLDISGCGSLDLEARAHPAA